MLFPSPLIPAVLVRRYKRFLADVVLADGTAITAHCPNPGAMTGYADPGLEVLLSLSANPARKLAHTLELVHNGACWIGVNTCRANAVVEEALKEGRLSGIAGYPHILREAPCGDGSRIDFLLTGPAGRLYLEVKSVTLLDAGGRYAFPDAVTARGLKHLGILETMARQGHRAMLLFLVQRSDGAGGFRAAAEVDPAYARGLERVLGNGVEAKAYSTRIDPRGISLREEVPVLVPAPPPPNPAVPG